MPLAVLLIIDHKVDKKLVSDYSHYFCCCILFLWPHINASCAFAAGCAVSLVTLSLWFHTRCWPVNISKGLCGLRLVHKGRFQHPGRRRLSENRGLSVRPGMQTIFNTAKIKLREKGAMPGSSSVIIFHIVGPLSPLIMHSMARWKKKEEGRRGKIRGTMSFLYNLTVEEHIQDIKGAKLSSVHI